MLFRSQIKTAMVGGQPANFTTRSNNVISEALHRVAYGSGSQAGDGKLRIAYSDGSEARAFPVGRLQPPGDDGNNSRISVRAALMSMRHLEMDPVVDCAWFRNSQVSTGRTMAEIDEFCFLQTLEKLDLFMERGVDLMRIYQTDFPPAVIGFYRGLAMKLKERGGCITVIPMYARGESFLEGSIWA